MTVAKPTSRALRRSAFTLIEVLIVVAILVVLMGVGAVQYMHYLEDSKKSAATMQIKNLSTVVDAYQIKFGEPPASLAALVGPEPDGSPSKLDGQKAIMDPWNHEYQYTPAGSRRGGRPEIWTVSPDGSTIGNW
ncbi:MAG: type II secretion system protein GspG [Gemmataceae bacterium]